MRDNYGVISGRHAKIACGLQFECRALYNLLWQVLVVIRFNATFLTLRPY